MQKERDSFEGRGAFGAVFKFSGKKKLKVGKNDFAQKIFNEEKNPLNFIHETQISHPPSRRNGKRQITEII